MSGAGPARSVGVALTFADRDPRLVVNLMKTLEVQTHPPEAVALVNFGQPCAELERLATPLPYFYRHLPQGEVFSMTLAENQSFRLLPPLESILFLDGDMLLAPDFVERGLRHLQPGFMINCRTLDLPREAITPRTDVIRDFDRLKALAAQRKEITAVGACQWVRTKAFHDLRGHDEGFKMWCFEDMDFHRRARWLGLRPVALDKETSLLHQWHPSKDDVIKNPKAPQAKAARLWYKKNLARLRARALRFDIGKYEPQSINPHGWGKMGPDDAGEPRAATRRKGAIARRSVTIGEPALPRSVGVVVTFANRNPQSVLNLIRTLAAQTRLPDAMALVNFGSPCPELATAPAPFPYIYRHVPQGAIWSISLAKNQGARLLPRVESLLFLDADMLVAPDLIELGLRRLDPGRMINCHIHDLPREAIAPQTDVIRDFDALKTRGALRKEITAVGACQWVWAKAFRAMRGYDEAFKMWCFEDMDFQRRARWLGLLPVALETETTMLHQWHPSKDALIKNPNSPEAQAANRWYKKNLRRLRTRAIFYDIGVYDARNINPQGWGELARGR